MPVANFNVVVITGYIVNVTSTSTDSDGTIASYSWKWDDGTANGTLQSMNHTYQYAGTYNVALTVVDDDGGVSATSKIIAVTVPSTLPTANFVFTVTKLSVTFNASTSTDLYGIIANYTWTYGDTVIETKTSVDTTHVYNAAGTYTVILKITDDHNATATVTKTVTTIANALPVANFVTAVSGYTVTVNSSSTDSDGTVTTYAYSWGDGTSNGTTINGTHTYATAGTYTITLSVKDNDGASSASNKTLQVTVPSVMPSASFSATVTKLSVSFDTTATTSPSGAIASYLWTYGDGNTETKSTANATHVYSAAGTYTVTLKITDDHGAISTVSKSITTVANVLPVADFTTSVSGYTVTVNSSSSDSDGTVTTYAY